MKQHKQLEKKIDQIDGNSEMVKTAENIWKAEEERKQYLDFIRTFLLTSTMGNGGWSRVGMTAVKDSMVFF